MSKTGNILYTMLLIFDPCIHYQIASSFDARDLPDPSIRILAVSYAGAVEGSKAAFHLGRGCGHEKRTVLPSNGLSRERAEHPERAPNGFPGEAPPQNALEIFR